MWTLSTSCTCGLIYPPAKGTLFGDYPADARGRGTIVPCCISWLNESLAGDVLNGHGAGPDCAQSA